MTAATRPTTMQPSPRFWDRIAERYARRPIADEQAYERKLQITRDHLRPDMKLLEFGCGTGTTALKHAPFVRHILAIDISGKMIEIAERKAAAEDTPNVTFRRGTIEDFSAPDASFDAVLGLSILHLLEDKEAAIAKVHRLLKPGGVFVSSTACLRDMMPLFRFVAPLGRVLGLLPLVKFFSKDELLRSLTAAGFAIEHQWQPGKGKGVFIVAKKPE